MTWPKTTPALSSRQLQIRDDFMQYWHDVLPRRYGIIERFNHGYAVSRATAEGRTLELGAGIGGHIGYEDLRRQEYHAVELRPELAERIRASFPSVHVLVGDCQEPLPFAEESFDRVLAIHVLEHLPNLPAALEEVARLLAPSGRFVVVIPCEGGMAYSLARRVSAQRLFERRYGMSYDWLIASEHINRPREIISELEARFRIVETRWFPLRLPVVALNLAIGLTLAPR